MKKINANKERKNDKDILLNDKQSSKFLSTKETLKSLGLGLITVTIFNNIMTFMIVNRWKSFADRENDDLSSG